uniref:Uncharacterized protein n=1 Tax=Trichuris muris TaxID=70415 RepID=A0A5S6Q4U1_TRIMR
MFVSLNYSSPKLQPSGSDFAMASRVGLFAFGFQDSFTAAIGASSDAHFPSPWTNISSAVCFPNVRLILSNLKNRVINAARS